MMTGQIDIQDVIKIAKEAGNAIMQIYSQDFKVEYKKDHSPLTQADRKSHEIIEHGLSQLSINFPILSEEGREVPYEERKEWEYFWLIDPLDGTKEFVNKNNEFTVNVALVHNNTPVLGVVYAPALDICYWAEHGKGAFKDGLRLPLKEKEISSTCKIVVSRSHMSNETKEFIDSIKTSKEKELVSMGSSLKICLVAEGEAQIYPRLGPTMEWDTGAAHAIIIESGAKLKKYENNMYTSHEYNKPNLLNSWFVSYS